MEVYVSTSAIKNPFQLKEVLEKYNELGIKNVELGSSHSYIDDIEGIIGAFNNNYIIHNYFPPLKDPIALNIASLNKDIRERSINLAKRAIDLCVKFKAPIYSMHAGMLADPSEIKFFEGFTFSEESKIESIYDLVFENLISSCKEINLYAKKNRIKFAVETSGGHPKKFDFLLMTKIKEFKHLISEVNDDNFGILLDIGHYNLSVNLYKGESIEKFVSEFKNHIFQVHLHHNDGSDDQHFPPTLKELKCLSKLNKNTIIVLESMNNSADSILEQYSNIKNYLLKE